MENKTEQDYNEVLQASNALAAYPDSGMAAIQEGMLRIIGMPQATADAVIGLGMDVAQIQKDFTDGTKTVFEIIQDISGEMSKLPENSDAVGVAIADIFGGAGEMAGLQYLSMLKDIDLEL